MLKFSAKFLFFLLWNIFAVLTFLTNCGLLSKPLGASVLFEFKLVVESFSRFLSSLSFSSTIGIILKLEVFLTLQDPTRFSKLLKALASSLLLLGGQLALAEGPIPPPMINAGGDGGKARVPESDDPLKKIFFYFQVIILKKKKWKGLTLLMSHH